MERLMARIKLSTDERGAVYPYLMFWVVVIICALVWIVFNEVILHVGTWVSASATGDPGFTWTTLLTLYRITPIIVILSAFVWAVVQSHRHMEAY